MVRRRVFAALIAGVSWVALGAVPGGAAAPHPVRELDAARGAVKLVTPRGRPLQGRWQSWADASLMPTVDTQVVVHLTRCPARPRAAGCVYPGMPRSVWIRPGLRAPRGVLLHELGHLYDIRVMNNRDRGRFRHIMGRTKKRKWWVGGIPLAEQFAEAYSWCARYSRIVSIGRYSSYRYRPSPRQHARACRLIERVAGDGAKPKPPPSPPIVTGPDPSPPAPPSTAPGTVPGDPDRDPGPQPPEDPDEPLPLPLPSPSPVPTAPPSPTPVATATPVYPIPTPPGG